MERLEPKVECVTKKLRVKCMKCGKEWEKESLISWGSDDFTSSLCHPCFREVISPIIHRKQLNEGNLDCFGKAEDDCDQLQCKYIKWCLRFKETDKVEKAISRTG